MPLRGMISTNESGAVSARSQENSERDGEKGGRNQTSCHLSVFLPRKFPVLSARLQERRIPIGMVISFMLPRRMTSTKELGAFTAPSREPNSDRDGEEGGRR